MNTSKNLSATLIVALSKLLPDETVLDFCAKHNFDPAECYLNATEVADPAKLLVELENATQEITEKFEQDINILTLFDYGTKIKKSYIYYQGAEEPLFAKKFIVNISHASNALALRVEESLESIAKFAPDQLAMVSGASSSFASSVRYHECGKPVIMIADKTMNNFKNNFADCLVQDARPSELLPVPVTYDLILKRGVSQTIADIAGQTVNITKLGNAEAAKAIVKLILETEHE